MANFGSVTGSPAPHAHALELHFVIPILTNPSDLSWLSMDSNASSLAKHLPAGQHAASSCLGLKLFMSALRRKLYQPDLLSHNGQNCQASLLLLFR